MPPSLPQRVPPQTTSTQVRTRSSIYIYCQKADMEFEIFRVVSEMWHPNIDKDGKVCISILHEPGWYS